MVGAVLAGVVVVVVEPLLVEDAPLLLASNGSSETAAPPMPTPNNARRPSRCPSASPDRFNSVFARSTKGFLSNE